MFFQCFVPVVVVVVIFIVVIVVFHSWSFKEPHTSLVIASLNHSFFFLSFLLFYVPSFSFQFNLFLIYFLLLS